jgi:hypothetical protein
MVNESLLAVSSRLDPQHRAITADDADLLSRRQVGTGNSPDRVAQSEAAEAVGNGLFEDGLMADERVGAAVEIGSVGLAGAVACPAGPDKNRDQRQDAEHEPLEGPGDRLEEHHQTGDEPGNAEPEKEAAGHDEFERQKDEPGNDPGPWCVGSKKIDENHGGSA